MPAERQLTALGVYIFAGGFTVGVRQAGFRVLAHLEDGDYGVETAKLNLPGLRVCTDPASWPLAQFAGRTDFVYSNPPCAAWSAAGVSSSAKWQTDGRVDCTRRSFEVFKAVRPAVWCWESVARAYTLGRPLVDQFTREALDLGYSTTHLLVDARHLGCPQRRSRFFMVVHRVRLEFSAEGLGTVTVSEALRGVPDEPRQPLSGAAWVRLLPELEPGREMRRLFEARNPDAVAAAGGGKVVGRPSFQVRRLNPDDVSFTLTGGAQMIHPTEDRYISVPESAALCGYPSDFRFVGTLSRQYAQVAQAVMPPVGRWLAEAVAAGVRSGRPTSGEVRLVDLRGGGVGQTTTVGAPGAAQDPDDDPDDAGTEITSASDGEADGAETTTSPAPARREGSGAFIRRLLAERPGMPHAQVVAMVRRRFPQSRATVKDVAWNLAKLRREGGAPAVAQRQPTRKKTLPAHVDPDREFDTTSLTAAGYGTRVHRDYAAHFFRWGFAKRFCRDGESVLDVGCGVDCPFVRTFVGGYPDGLPSRYVGVDLNPLPRPPARGWATFQGEFNFLERRAELGTFDLVVCFEVIEHMRAGDGRRLLAALRDRLAPGGTLLLSTPVFDGRAAANHLHEWTVPELRGAVEEAGLSVRRRYGTFANYNALRKVVRPEELELMDRIGQFYSNDVTACFLAPLYPDASRNNVWVLRRKE